MTVENVGLGLGLGLAGVNVTFTEENVVVGALLQCIPWTGGATYHDLCTVYTDYGAMGRQLSSLMAMVKHPQRS